MLHFRPPRAQQLSRDELIEEAWTRGRLRWLLRDYQRPIYDDIKARLWGGDYLEPKGEQRKYILEIHRRFGKSAVCGIIACELAIQRENARIYWAAETGKQVGKILNAVLPPILASCPKHLRPEAKKADGMVVWPNGSEFHLAGCEDEMKADRLRGDGADFFIIDEAGSIDVLQYVYRSIALWMTSDRDGRICMPSTPARSPAHPFTAYCVLAEAGDGGFSHRSVYESGWPDERINELAKECGGFDSADWRREGLAERVVDFQRAIVPEFSEDGAEDAICRPLCTACGLHFDKHGPEEQCPEASTTFVWELERPDYFDPYVSGDPGWYPDLYALLFAYQDFRRALTVVEDELGFSKPTTDDVATGIKRVEALRWSEYFAKLHREYRSDEAKPYKRVTDIDWQIIADLRRLHELDFVPTRKDDADAQVNEMRLVVKHRRIAIHPRCKRLRAHLKAGIKTKNGKDWERIEGFGHFDFIAALIYLLRNVDRQHNPYPAVPFGLPDNVWLGRQKPAAVPEHLQGWQGAFPSAIGGR